MGAVDWILGKLGLARLSAIPDLANELKTWQLSYAAVVAERDNLIRKIEAKAHSVTPKNSKLSGAQLRRMNEQFNAQVSREMEPRSNSEILKEQANG